MTTPVFPPVMMFPNAWHYELFMALMKAEILKMVEKRCRARQALENEKYLMAKR